MYSIRLRSTSEWVIRPVRRRHTFSIVTTMSDDGVGGVARVLMLQPAGSSAEDKPIEQQFADVLRLAASIAGRRSGRSASHCTPSPMLLY
jgi:hypothetical protein